mmetsp:Transcript_28602/g.62392  ORF Transcript_28602/g.62392 Transcript_28602/m.62392 type:complete len:201 (-) Transcript_28602:642-1244(-)
MPYLLPCTMEMVALSKSFCLGAESVKFSHTKASPAAGGSFLPPSRTRVKVLRSPNGSSSSHLKTGFFSRCFSWSRASLLVNFSPFSTLASTASIFSSNVGSCFPVFFSLAASRPALLAAACALLSSNVSSSASSSGKASKWKSGCTNRRHSCTPGGGFGIATRRASGSRISFLFTSTISSTPSSMSGSVKSSPTISQVLR